MDEKIEKAISKIINMYEKIENDLLIKIASHFSINDEFLNSDYWRIKKLEEMGLFNQDIIDYLARETRKTKAEVKKALNQIGIDTINLDGLNRLFEDEVLKINPNILVNNYTIKNIINSAYNEVSNTLIQMSSKIEKSARQAYLNVVEEAYLKTSMGTHSYQEAIKESINDLSNKGIKILTYKTIDENENVVGIRNYDIEGAVRREVLTASRQLNNAIAMEMVKKLDCEYLYLSEHLQCRPAHFDWQGTIIRTEDLIKITHYGEVDGLAGINCRHYFEPYFGDARGNDLKHFNKKDCINAYNLSQKQRYLERGIRKWKRKAEMFKANGDIESYKKCKSKVYEWQSRINNFENKKGLKRDYNREYVKENKNKEFNQKIKEIAKNEKVGKFDVSEYSNDIVTTTNDVVLTDERKRHIIDKHPEVEKYFDSISSILKNPDRVFKQLDKEDTLWIIKELDDNIKITLKLNTINSIHPNYKNSIIQMQIMKQNRIEKYIQKGKLKELLKKKK